MLLPIGDEPNHPKHIAWMNYALIAVNVVTFVWMRSTHPTDDAFGRLIFQYGYKPADASIGAVFTSMFMHAGWLHLIGNMWFLYIFGDNIEARLGAFGYLVAYLAVGAAATLVFGAFNSGSEVPLVGASGAISGVEGLYFVACPRHRVKVFVFLYVIITVVKVNARWIMAFWFVMQDLIPVLVRIDGVPGDNVAHLAHLGGFASGLALMLVLRPLAPRIEAAALYERGAGDRYTGGRAASHRYGRNRRHDPYESGIRRRSRLDPPT